MADLVIAGKDCASCQFGRGWHEPHKIYCEAREKTYYYGQYVQCEDYKAIEKEIDDE